MIKNFGQWEVVKDGIQTIAGYEYFHISKDKIMNNDRTLARRLMEISSINKKSLISAFEYAYRYFHAMSKYTAKSHPEEYKHMSAQFKDLTWIKTEKGNFTVRTPEGINITVYKNSKGRWAWIYNDIHSQGSYKNMETARKKAFASYYWLYKHIKNGI